MARLGQVVTTADEARANILRYAREVRRNAELREIMSYARGWYACRSKAGGWAFAPSKFAGYLDNDAETYLRSHQQRDGRLTERILVRWFLPLPATARLHQELSVALAEFFSTAGKTPNRLVHLHVLRTDMSASSRITSDGDAVSRQDLAARITTDAAVLGGRPVIRGMRISVSDVLDLLAAGVSREEILSDFPYLEPEDISAALEYAARSVDHPVIRAA